MKNTIWNLCKEANSKQRQEKYQWFLTLICSKILAINCYFSALLVYTFYIPKLIQLLMWVFKYNEKLSQSVFILLIIRLCWE